jgi:hypothetical protein
MRVRFQKNFYYKLVSVYRYPSLDSLVTNYSVLAFFFYVTFLKDPQPFITAFHCVIPCFKAFHYFSYSNRLSRYPKMGKNVLQPWWNVTFHFSDWIFMPCSLETCCKSLFIGKLKSNHPVVKVAISAQSSYSELMPISKGVS